MVTRTVKLPQNLLNSLMYLIDHFPTSQTKAYVKENGFPKMYSMPYTMALRTDYFICNRNQKLISAVQDEELKFYCTDGIPDTEFVAVNTILHVYDPIRPLVDRAIELQNEFINDMSIGNSAYISA